MIWDFAEGVGLDRRRWNVHIECRAIVRLKSEQRKVHVREMFPPGCGGGGGREEAGGFASV